MRLNRTIQNQRGFFDLGLGLALTMLFSGTAVVIDASHTDQTSVAKQETEVVQIVDEQLAFVELDTGC